MPTRFRCTVSRGVVSVGAVARLAGRASSTGRETQSKAACGALRRGLVSPYPGRPVGCTPPTRWFFNGAGEYVETTDMLLREITSCPRGAFYVETTNMLLREIALWPRGCAFSTT